MLFGAQAWYPPLTSTIGTLGIALTATAFATIHHPRRPFALLIGATALLAINTAMVYTI